MKLTRMGDNDQQRDFRLLEDKARELELKLRNGVDKYAKIKDQQLKLQADYKLLQNKLVQVTYENQELIK